MACRIPAEVLQWKTNDRAAAVGGVCHFYPPGPQSFPVCTPQPAPGALLNQALGEVI